MNAVLASTLITAIGGIVVVLLTNRANKKGADATNALQERAVDREDFQTFVEELRASLADVRAELAEVKAELATEVGARKKAEERASKAEERANAAEQKATELERRVTQLEQENEKLRDDLQIATRLLEQKYPDDQPDLE